MPDDLSIPTEMPAQTTAPFTHSYRARRGLDDGTRRLLVVAGGVGLLLVGLLGGWALTGRQPAVVPVIEADSRPLRVKPENAGGMQVAGADEQVMGGPGGAGAAAMAPAAETPAPQALRAQMKLPVTAPAAAPEPVAAVPAAPVVAGPVAGNASPLPDTPPVAPRSTARPATPAASGAALVQLAAVDSEPAAQAEWQRLAKRMPDLLGSHRVVLQKVERDGHAVWRVRTGGFADTAEASGFCARVRAKGSSCAVASF